MAVRRYCWWNEPHSLAAEASGRAEAGAVAAVAIKVIATSTIRTRAMIGLRFNVTMRGLMKQRR